MFDLSLFPRLTAGSYKVTSERDARYNCIAYAVGDHSHWWWPSRSVAQPGEGHLFWPSSAPLDDSIESFTQAFDTLGFVPCGDGSLEHGAEKISLYAIAGKVKHAARQTADGKWCSKLGREVDIEHSLNAVGPAYGHLVGFFRRGSANQGPKVSPASWAERLLDRIVAILRRLRIRA